MLVLTRKLGENVVIGNDVSVKVVNIENNKVQLGIQAPSSVMIYRQELVERVTEQNRASVVQGKQDILEATRMLKRLFHIKM